MAYNNKLRPKKYLLEGIFRGKFGKFDLTDEPMKWKDFTNEMLVEFVNTHNAKTVATHLTGDIPVLKSTKKLSPAPSTDELQPKDKK